MTELEIIGGPYCGNYFVLEDEELSEGDQVQLDAETDLWFELRDGRLQIIP